VPRQRLTHVYHFGVAAIGLLLLIQNTSRAELVPQLGDLLTFLLLSLVVKRAGFHVAPIVTHSLGGVVDLAALLIFGAAGGGWIAGLSSMLHIVGIYFRRHNTTRRMSASLAAFGFGLKACMAFIAVQVYLGLGGVLRPATIAVPDLLPIAALCLAWFSLDHLGWSLREFIEKGRQGVAVFLRRLFKASLLVELLPLPAGPLLAYVYDTLQRPVFWVVGLGVIVVSVAVQRVADLSLAYRRRDIELQTLNDFSRDLSAARLDEAQILELVYRYATRVADTSNFALSLIDERTHEVDLALWYRDGARQPPRHYERWGGLAGWVVEQRRPLLSVDTAKEPLPVRGLLLTAKKTRAALFVPLLTKDKTLGVVSVQSHEPGTYTREHERLFFGLATQAAIEIEQARLSRAQLRRTRQLETIAEVSQRVAGIFDLDELMDFVTALIKVNFAYYHVDIYLLHGNRLVHQAGTVPARSPHGFEIYHTSLISTVATTEEPLLVNDVSKEPRFRYDPNAPYTAAELVVPLKADGKLLGVLEVQADTVYAFSDSDVGVMQTLGNQVSLAIQEAELFASVQQEAYISNALLQVADAVGSQSDIQAILEALVRIIPLLVGVERCLVLLWDPQAGELVAGASFGLPAESKRALTGVRFAPRTLFGDQSLPITPQRLVLPADLAEAWHMSSVLLLPMLMRGAFLGTMCVDAPALDIRRESLLTGIAHQAALAIESVEIESERDLRARLAQELNIGRTIQASLLPRGTPHVAGFDLAALWRPALQVAGDFYDFIPLLDENWGIVVADVSDKGVPAAIYMTLARTIIRAIGLGRATRRTPHQVLERANEIIMSDASTDMFVTAFYAMLDPQRCLLRYAVAGHCPPLLVRAGDCSSTWLSGKGLALGVLESIELEEHEVIMQAGDVVVFYTDGVTEATNADDELFGQERLREAVCHAGPMGAQDLLAHIVNVVDGFAGRHEQVDDLTLVVLRCGQADMTV
jgi:serine phosphatase RsbU (regulator of sigma subunit)/putative methionine-R-sulfoxide reductase with GAF domain